jgi:hydroxyethylthiazole kinase
MYKTLISMLLIIIPVTSFSAASALEPESYPERKVVGSGGAYDSARVARELQNLRDSKPLVHNITNFVTMDFVANALLSVGASPLMSHAPEEMEELAGISNTLVLNIGTLSAEWIQTMREALTLYKENGKPVVLDPVGAGATTFRTDSCLNLIEQGGIRVIRGNGSEILGLISRERKTTRGVESTISSLAVKEEAIQFALDKNLVVVVSGPIDIVTDGHTTYEIDNGHSLMTKVTGVGCVATALVGAFVASCPEDPLLAAVSAMGTMGVCGELAAKKTSSPGSFRKYFIDGLTEVTPADIIAHLKVRRI